MLKDTDQESGAPTDAIHQRALAHMQAETEQLRSNREHSIDQWPWLIFAIAVVIRLTYFWQYLQSPLFNYFRADQLYYLRWAREIAAGDWLGSEAFEMGPLYPYLVGAAFSVCGENQALLLIVQLFLGALCAPLLYTCGCRLFDRPTGIVAGLLLGVYGPCIFYECMMMKSFLSPLLTVVTLYAAVRYRENRAVVWLWVAGAAVGMACLVRENHILLLLPVGIWILLTGAKCNVAKTRVLLHGAHMVAGLVLVLTPSAVRNYVVAREFVVVTAGGGEVFYIAHRPGARPYYSAPHFVTGNPFYEHEDFRKEAERRTGQRLSRSESSRYWYREAVKCVLDNPVHSARLTGQKAAVLFNDYEVADGENFLVTRSFISCLAWLPTFGWFGGLGFLGMLVCLMTKRAGWIVVAFVGVHVVCVLLLYNFARFRLGLMPMWMLLAALGITWLVDLSRHRVNVSWLKFGCAAIFVGTITWVMLRPPAGGIPPGHEVVRAIATGDLFMKRQKFELAEQEYGKITAVCERNKLKGPNVVRWRLAAYLGLARICRKTDRPQGALQHLQAALDMQMRETGRRIVLRRWIDFLEECVRVQLHLEGLSDPGKTLADSKAELSRLDQSQR